MNRTRLGIIGKPLGHSLSPVLHTKGMEGSGEIYSYEKWELEEEQLEKFLLEIKSDDSNILGFNVTIPYKEKIIQYLDLLDSKCKLLGAVNTVKYEDGKLIGYNTDGLGFIESLKRHDFYVSNKKILIIGSGGAARGIALFLSQLNIKSIDVVARNEEKSKQLLKEVEKFVPAEFFKLDEIFQTNVGEYDLIIQTTPVGMKNIKGNLEFPYEELKTNQVVVDIVYNPLDTDFLKNCIGKVKETISGLEMLVYQGYHSFKIWTGKEENTEVMLETGRNILEGKSE